MSGSLTVGGMAAGLLSGETTIGPSTITGKASITEIINIELVANTDFVVKVPTEAVAFAVVFTFEATTAPEVKLRTNLNSTDTGLPIISQGWLALPIYTGVTELKFKAVTPPALFQLTFI